jgi:signal recognition particle receptor subunit beta
MPGTAGIGLRGSFLMFPRPAAGLVLYDTPGSNSQNTRHRQTMQLALRNVDFQALIYVMNAQHPATDEDRATLESLREETRSKSKHKIWFILNKTDSFDRAKGESLADSVNDAAKYLKGIGFADPLVIPALANAALYAKKALFGQDITRRQNDELRDTLERLSKRGERMMKAALIPDMLRRHWHVQLKEWKGELAERLGLNRNCWINRLINVASARIDALENEQEDIGKRLENPDSFQDTPQAANALTARLAEIDGELRAIRSCAQKPLLSASGVTALEFLLCHEGQTCKR